MKITTQGKKGIGIKHTLHYKKESISLRGLLEIEADKKEHHLPVFAGKRCTITTILYYFSCQFFWNHYRSIDHE